MPAPDGPRSSEKVRRSQSVSLAIAANNSNSSSFTVWSLSGSSTGAVFDPPGSSMSKICDSDGMPFTKVVTRAYPGSHPAKHWETKAVLEKGVVGSGNSHLD